MTLLFNFSSLQTEHSHLYDAIYHTIDLMCLSAYFLCRNMIPSNLIEATFQQVSSLEGRRRLFTTGLFCFHCTHINIFFSSLFLLQYRTDLVPIVQSADVKQSQANYVYVMPDYHNPKLGHPVFLEITPAPDIKYKIVPSTSKGMNVLGIVIFSATMGETIRHNSTQKKHHPRSDLFWQ